MAIRETFELDLTRAQEQIDRIESRINSLGKPVVVPLDVTSQGLDKAETDSEQLRRELDKVETSADKVAATGKKIGSEYQTGTTKAERGLSKMSTSLKTLATAAAGYAIFRFAKESIARAEELASAYAVTTTVIEQTGQSANVTAEQIAELSKQESIATGIDKALVTEGNNVLLTFKNIKNEAGAGNDVFTRTSRVMLDVATVMGTDAKSAALQLAKALNDPIGQLGALSRAGVTFNDQQKEQIKTLAQNGNLLGAQKIILQEIESEFGNTAEAAANATDKIRNIGLEFQESLGTIALPLLDAVAGGLQIIAESDPFAKFAVKTGQAEGSALNLLGVLSEINKGGRDSSNKRFVGKVNELIDASGAGRDALQELLDNMDLFTSQGVLTGQEADQLSRILEDRLAVSQDNVAKNFERGRTHAAYFAGTLEDINYDVRAMDEAFGGVTPTVDTFSQTLLESRGAMQTFSDSVDDTAQNMVDAFSPVPDQIDLTLIEITGNLTDWITKQQQWVDGLKQLAADGMGSFAEELRAAGHLVA